MAWCERHGREPGHPTWPCPPTEGAASEVIYECGCHWAWCGEERPDGTTSYVRVDLEF